MSSLLVPVVYPSFQLAAFAHEIEIFDSINDYEISNAEADDEIMFASQSFGPARMFDEDAITYAVFTGHIVQAELKENELTGNSFYWARAHSLGDAQFDAVIDPGLVEDEHPPQAGGVVKANFWLSGRLVPGSVVPGFMFPNLGIEFE